MPGTAVALHSVKDLPISMIGAQVQESALVSECTTVSTTGMLLNQTAVAVVVEYAAQHVSDSGMTTSVPQHCNVLLR